MTIKQEQMWTQDKVWSEADKMWRLADEVFKEAETEAQTVINKDGHTLRFRAKTFPQRCRLFRRFFGMAWQVFWRGKTEFKFKSR